MKLGIGAAQFGLDYGIANYGGRIAKSEAHAIIAQASHLGINTLDTAIAYGDSESVLGALNVGHWQVVTKLSGVPEGCSDVAAWIDKEIRQSLDRIQVNQLHGVLLHRPAQLLSGIGEDIYAGLRSIKACGLTKKIGISVYDTAELDQIFDIFDIFDFDLVQAPLNILDRRLVNSGWAEKLKKAGIELHARSVFLQGLLLLPPSQRPPKFNVFSDVLNIWDQWLSRNNQSPLEACLRYVNSISEVDRIIVGVDSARHLNQIIDALGGTLNALPDFQMEIDPRLLNPASWVNL